MKQKQKFLQGSRGVCFKVVRGNEHQRQPTEGHAKTTDMLRVRCVYPQNKNVQIIPQPGSLSNLSQCCRKQVN